MFKNFCSKKRKKGFAKNKQDLLQVMRDVWFVRPAGRCVCTKQRKEEKKTRTVPLTLRKENNKRQTSRERRRKKEEEKKVQSKVFVEKR